MITIPTLDLIGMSKDALLFTAPEKDFPELARVRYGWDGNTLHVTASNLLTDCHATWDPDADEFDGPDQWEGTRWGGADDPWSVVVSADNVKHLIKSLSVSVKLARCPLTVEVERAHLVVKRSRDTGLSAVTNRYVGSLDPFPDVEKQIAAIGVPKPADSVSFHWPAGTAVARVAKRRGMQVDLLPCTEALGVSIGNAFTACIRTSAAA